MIYLYGITERSDRALPGVAGIGDTKLTQFRLGDLAAVASEHGSDALSAEPEALWSHEEVVEALMRNRTVVPARFGTVFETEAALTDALGAATKALLENLARVEGCVEYGLRVMDQEGSPPLPDEATSESASGKAYMESLLARTRGESVRVERAKELLQQLTFDSKVRDRVVKIAPSPRTLLSLAYLVARADEASFVEDLNEAQRHFSTPMLATGPWPPYSFVSIPRDESQAHEEVSSNG